MQKKSFSFSLRDKTTKIQSHEHLGITLLIIILWCHLFDPTAGLPTSMMFPYGITYIAYITGYKFSYSPTLYNNLSFIVSFLAAQIFENIIKASFIFIFLLKKSISYYLFELLSFPSLLSHQNLSISEFLENGQESPGS